MMRFKHLSVALLLAVVLVPRFAVADNKAVAREAYRNGTRMYDLGHFKEALAEFEKAYVNFEDSALLFNLAQCHRQLDHKADALHFYRTYLYTQPNAPNAEQVRQMIADLEQALKEDQARANKPPVGVSTAGLGEAPSPAPVAQPVTVPLPSSEAVVATAPARAPAYKKWWVWTLVGVGVAAIAVGVGVGVTANQKSEANFGQAHF